MQDVNELEMRAVCEKYNLSYSPPKPSSKLGIAESVRGGLVPLNGLRHRPTVDTSGWFIWAGEVLSSEPNFFVPLHVEHVSEWCPSVEKFLGLPPGSRFLLAGDHEDVWEDASLLDV